MRHRGSTPPFRTATGDILRGGVALMAYLRLGGLDQWVMIRNQAPPIRSWSWCMADAVSPKLRLFRYFNAPLEKSFTVVYWEQRGTGKSFDSKIAASSMTVEQFIADLDELVDAVRKRFGEEKVAIYGHSWGSALGVLYAARFPEKVSAYVGAAQVGDWPASEAMCYDFTLAEAERRGNRIALRELRAIGPPSHTGRRQMVQGKWLTRFVGMVRGMSLWRMSRIILSGPKSSVLDLPNILRGTLFSTDTMWNEVSALNLIKAAPVLQMPVFFFIGRHDHVIDPKTSIAYFDMLTAPSKKLVWRGVGPRAALRGTGEVQCGNGRLGTAGNHCVKF